jgi:sigma-B regulation protein RsbU (phosphoserine phosphatase)
MSISHAIACRTPRTKSALLLPVKLSRLLVTISSAALLLMALASATAQTEINNCVWHAGDNPAWASPTLDQSQWKPLPASALPDEAHFWIRCPVPADALRSATKPSVLVEIWAAYEVYWQGNLTNRVGNLRTGDHSINAIRVHPVSRPSGTQPAILALRLAYRPELDATGFGAEAGDAPALEGDRAKWIVEGVRPSLGFEALYLIVGIVGLVQLGVWAQDRTRRDLLWLSLYCIAVTVLHLCQFFFAAQADLSMRVWHAIFSVANLNYIPQVLFYFAFVRKRIPWFVWALFVLFAAQDLIDLVQVFVPLDLASRLPQVMLVATFIRGFTWALLTLAPFLAFWPWRRIALRLRAVMLCCFVLAIADFVYVLCQMIILYLMKRPDMYDRYYYVQLEVRAVVTCATLLVLFALLFRDQRRVSEDRAVLAGELQAARQIQRMLAPEVLATVPGVAVQVAFRPMRDVGGDFYLCRPLDDGSQRLLMGDVSGKGTAAAMTAALLMGGAADHDALAPGQLLDHLDRVLCQSRVGGFATCICADLAADGTVTIANAGHLSPYCNGREVPIAAALPLGISASSQDPYGETIFSLGPGETLTFLSDGVVEARDTKGELFGFDRARATSTQPAEEIATSAQQFGQEDDITVLTVTFAPAVAAVS